MYLFSSLHIPLPSFCGRLATTIRMRHGGSRCSSAIHRNRSHKTHGELFCCLRSSAWLRFPEVSSSLLQMSKLRCHNLEWSFLIFFVPLGGTQNKETIGRRSILSTVELFPITNPLLPSRTLATCRRARNSVLLDVHQCQPHLACCLTQLIDLQFKRVWWRILHTRLALYRANRKQNQITPQNQT